MANWTQANGATKPATNPAEVSSEAPVSGSVTPAIPPVSGSVAPAIPCLIPSFADAAKLLSSRYSCLVLDTHRRHVSLPPVYLRKKRTGIQEELNSDLLKYSSSLSGVPMAYDNIKVIGQHGDIYDDQGFIHINIQASFIIFKPERGSKLVGVINKIGMGHVGCLVHGCFNASVVKPSLLTPEQWRDCGLCIGETLEFEVFQMDADAAGVLLIRGRLEKSRVQELVAQIQQTEAAVNLSTEAENTEDTADSPKLKTKDEHEKQAVSVHDRIPSQTCENNETDVNGIEVDSNSNHLHKKKKKKDRTKQSDEILPSELPVSDSSGYMSDKTSRKRRAHEMEDNTETPVSKKKRKSK